MRQSAYNAIRSTGHLFGTERYMGEHGFELVHHVQCAWIIASNILGEIECSPLPVWLNFQQTLFMSMICRWEPQRSRPLHFLVSKQSPPALYLPAAAVYSLPLHRPHLVRHWSPENQHFASLLNGKPRNCNPRPALCRPSHRWWWRRLSRETSDRDCPPD